LRFHPALSRPSSSGDRNSHTRSARRKDAPEETIMELINRLRMLARDSEGQDLIEYALLVGLISLVAVVAIGLAGGSVNGIFNAIVGQLNQAGA